MPDNTPAPTQAQTPAAAPQVMQFTDEQFRAFMEEQRAAATPTQADIEAAAGEIATQDEQRTQRQRPDLGAATDVTIRDTDSRGLHWRRRVIRYFNALATKKDSEHRASEMIARLARDVQQIPERQLRDEETEAVRVLERSGLPETRQEIGRQLLGIGEYRLLTSVEGDTQGTDNLLPLPFLAQIFILTEQYGVARQIFRVIPFSGPGNVLSLKNIVGRVIAYWVDQGELIPPSDLEFDANDLVLNKLAGITSWTTEAQEDTAFNLIPIIQADFAEALAYKEDLAGFLGDGTATYGGFTGVVNFENAAVVHIAGTGTSGANGVTEAKLRALKQSVSMSRRGNARWLMHESIMDEIRQLENTAGYRLFTEPLTQGGATSLLGYPVTFSEVMPAASSIDAQDEPILAFGDFGRVLMGIKRGMTADISREAILQNSSNGTIIYNAYQADGALLRVTERIGFAIPMAVEPAIAVLKAQSSAT